jgi:hypothetical protein
VKGDLHQRLQAALHRAWRDGVFKQESLSAEMGKSQRSVSAYLRKDADAGALDLDEADLALRHIGSSLPDFLAKAPPRELSDAERLAHALAARREVQPWVEGLLSVPAKKLPAVLELIGVGVRAATGQVIPGNSGSRAAPTPARRTTRARGSRPRAPKTR